MGAMENVIGSAEAEVESAAAHVVRARKQLANLEDRAATIQSDLMKAVQEGSDTHVRRLTDERRHIEEALHGAKRDLSACEEVAAVASHRYAQVQRELEPVFRPSRVQNPVIRDRKTVALEPWQAWAKLREGLITARLEAGNPSLTDLAVMASCSRSKLSRVFGGQIRPDTATLTALAEVLGVETRAFQTVWMPLWHAMMRGPAAPPVAASPRTTSVREPRNRPEGHGCSVCGAWVVNANRHLEWHMSLQNASAKKDTTVSEQTPDSPNRVSSFNPYRQRRTAG